MKVGLYIRVSTQEQAMHGESIQDQRQALEQWAKENNHTIVGIYSDEGISAHKAFSRRPALNKLLEDCKQDKINIVAFTKFDRWTRKASDYYKLQDILEAHNVTWTAILEDYNTTTTDGRFKVGIMLAVNQQEAERTSDRLKFTMQEKRKRGEIVSGNMPVGYVLENHKPIKDKKTEKAVQSFFDTYLSGLGVTKAIYAANSLGLHLTVEHGCKMLRTAKNYSGIIQNTICEPYITKEQLEFIQSRRKVRPRSTHDVYLFSGLISCAECGGCVCMQHMKMTKPSGGNYEYWKYYCRTARQTIPRECDNFKSVSESVIEEYLLDNLIPRLEEYKLEIKNIKSEDSREKLERKKASLEQRKSKLLSLYLDNIIERSEFEAERSATDAELSEIVEQLDNINPYSNITEIEKLLVPNWRSIYNELTKENKRTFWFKIIDKIYLHKDSSISFTFCK